MTKIILYDLRLDLVLFFSFYESWRKNLNNSHQLRRWKFLCPSNYSCVQIEVDKHKLERIRIQHLLIYFH